MPQRLTFEQVTGAIGIDVESPFDLNVVRIGLDAGADIAQRRTADHSVDLVAVPTKETESLAEARRVARFGVVLTTRAGIMASDDRLTIEWTTREPPTPLPSASIIIPTYNSLTHLKMCLHAVTESLSEGFRG